MYDFTDDEDNDVDLLNDSSTHHGNVESEREWSRMSNQFINAGYREGITAGKEAEVQAGFDAGFADLGAPIGRELGNLRGLAAGTLSFLQSSKMGPLRFEDRDGLLQEVREIMKGLADIQFTNLMPPDEEALAHAREHTEMHGVELQLSADISAARSVSLAELSRLRRRLENVLRTCKLDALLPLPERALHSSEAS